MNEFQFLDGRVLLGCNGVYKQADLYAYNGRIFAKYGQGFIGVNANETTTKGKVFWRDIEMSQPYTQSIGKLILRNSNAANAIAAE
jgi:hypothetical protein